MVALEILTKKLSKKSLDLKDQFSDNSKLNERITEDIVRDILKANQKKIFQSNHRRTTVAESKN